jgi:hypothetical protein
MLKEQIIIEKSSAHYPGKEKDDEHTESKSLFNIDTLLHSFPKKLQGESQCIASLHCRSQWGQTDVERQRRDHSGKEHCERFSHELFVEICAYNQDERTSRWTRPLFENSEND